MEETEQLNASFGQKIWRFFKTNIVFFIATIAAIISCFFIPPDGKYLGYFDFKTLTSLLCMLAVICALQNIDFFRILAGKIIAIFKTTRSSITALIFITYFASMLIANDMALITFLPLGYFVLVSTGKQKYMAYTFILQNIAANLGGMLTPFGNPQNLYLYNYYHIPNLEFFKIMAVPFAVSTVLLVIACLFVKKEKLEIQDKVTQSKFDPKRAIIYSIMFAYSIIIVFRIVPYWTGLFMLPLIFLLDHKALLHVDYMLLLTFCMFFIFAGNMARIEVVRQFLSTLINKNVLLTGVVSCQLISNVPTAILLSNFTTNYSRLLMAVNIAGCGTLISSLASLITFKEYVKHNKGKAGKYLIMCHAINFTFLAILILACYFLPF